MYIGFYCKTFRKSLNVIVKDLITEGKSVSTIYSFENGSSNNFDHLELYIKLAYSEGKLDEFLSGLAKEVLIKHDGKAENWKTSRCCNEAIR